MAVLSLGKQRRLTLLADYEGRFQLLTLAPPELPAERRALLAEVTGSLSTQASAVCAEPPELPLILPALDRGAALAAALNAPGELRILDGWSVAAAVRSGASAGWLRVAWAEAAAEPEREEVAAFVARVGDECAKHELPLLLEWQGSPAEAVAAAARLSVEECQVDLLALPAGSEVAALETLAAAAQLPWLVVGRGAVDDLLDLLPAAVAAGAVGFACGGATWGDAPLHDYDEWLVEWGLYHWRRAVSAAGRGPGWRAHPRFAGAEPVTGEDWFVRA